MEQQKAMGTQQKTKPNKTGIAQKDTSAKRSTSRSAKTARQLAKKNPHEK
jgi:hypothetical protein